MEAGLDIVPSPSLEARTLNEEEEPCLAFPPAGDVAVTLSVRALRFSPTWLGGGWLR